MIGQRAAIYDAIPPFSPGQVSFAGYYDLSLHATAISNDFFIRDYSLFPSRLHRLLVMTHKAFVTALLPDGLMLTAKPSN